VGDHVVDLVKAILLGIVEGVTEFLPISSTGHLILVGQWLDLRADLTPTFDIFIQLGAILAVVWLYRRRLWSLVVSLPTDRRAQRLALALALAFVPSGVLGYLGRGIIRSVLFNPVTVAIALIVGGVAILLLDRQVRADAPMKGLEAVTPQAGFGVGLAQALSLVPGVSRSAASILGGLATGMDRQTAVEFSFFLSIPTMFAATLYELVKSAPSLQPGDALLLGVGFVTAFVTALLVVQLFLRFVATHTFRPFAIYRIVLGVVVLALFFAGALP
jgi:undecaprenyl-diphosphatase